MYYTITMGLTIHHLGTLGRTDLAAQTSIGPNGATVITSRACATDRTLYRISLREHTGTMYIISQENCVWEGCAFAQRIIYIGT